MGNKKLSSTSIQTPASNTNASVPRSRPSLSQASSFSATPVSTSGASAFILSIELKAVHEFPETRDMFFAYSYPLLGNEPIVSPPSHVTAQQESALVGASNRFNLNLPLNQLQTVFQNDPLIFEVMGTDQSEIGIVKVSLATLLKAPLSNNRRQIHALFPMFKLVNNQVSQIGKLRLYLVLATTTSKVATPALQSTPQVLGGGARNLPSSGFPQGGPAMSLMETELRKRLEHQITWDLEVAFCPN